jgi:hypothetical protein
VGSLSELPPGKGKVVEVEGRRVTVFNDEGRFHASATRRLGHGVDAAPSATTCSQPGLHFDVFAEDSPADLEAEEECEVRVRRSDVWVVL